MTNNLENLSVCLSDTHQLGEVSVQILFPFVTGLFLKTFTAFREFFICIRYQVYDLWIFSPNLYS